MRSTDLRSGSKRILATALLLAAPSCVLGRGNHPLEGTWVTPDGDASASWIGDGLYVEGTRFDEQIWLPRGPYGLPAGDPSDGEWIVLAHASLQAPLRVRLVAPDELALAFTEYDDDTEVDVELRLFRTDEVRRFTSVGLTHGIVPIREAEDTEIDVVPAQANGS
ncbi:MAG: hypothetical protein R3F34_06190 [Planctomycetota bacterium]